MAETRWKNVGSSDVAEGSERIRNNLLRIRAAAASAVYLVLVFLVIYGLSDGVYQGFPKVVPYLIMLIFLAMAFIRMYQAVAGIISEKKPKELS
ncbi:MAG: hypothetical protein IIU00_03155 [Clostridia bacterium]|nr:hypothetical protein [Clostridia bacterium]